MSGGQALATHLRGGYVQAKSISATALTYEVTATIYYEGSASITGESSITLCFGDGITQEVFRQSQRRTADGLLTIGTYRITHTYAGPGTYTLTTSLANRVTTKNIVGVGEQLPMTLVTTFSTTTPNQTPALLFPETGFPAATNQRLLFPVNATDAEGDSLVYSLTRPLTAPTGNTCSGQTVTNYRYPNDLTRRGTFNIDSRTGNLTWDVPVEQGSYSVALLISEYRSNSLISQTRAEVLLAVTDRPGTPGTVPPYEPALENGQAGGLVTDLPVYRDEDMALTVFPNPVDDRLQVVIQTSNPTTARTRLLDGSGRVLHELTVDRSARRHEQVISMSSLAPGLYVIRADVGGRTMVRKVIRK